MALDTTPAPAQQSLDGIKLFDEFQAQSRARMEGTLKLMVGVSGAMLTLSVGAVLNGTPARIPAELIPTLKSGWVCLFFCIAASMLLMASMIAATFHMGVKMRQWIERKEPGVVFIATWSWLRIVNAVLGVVILVSFLAGIWMVAQVAVGVAESRNAAGTVPVL